MEVIESAAGGYGPPGGAGGHGPPAGSGGYPPPPGGYGAPPGAPGVPPAQHAGYPAQHLPVPGAPYGVEPLTGLPYSDKQKLVAGLLQLLMPGVGRLYAGHTGIGIAQLVSLLFCVGAIWGFVDAILILTGRVMDGEGRPLRD